MKQNRKTENRSIKEKSLKRIINKKKREEKRTNYCIVSVWVCHFFSSSSFFSYFENKQLIFVHSACDYLNKTKKKPSFGHFIHIQYIFSLHIQLQICGNKQKEKHLLILFIHVIIVWGEQFLLSSSSVRVHLFLDR